MVFLPVHDGFLDGGLLDDQFHVVRGIHHFDGCVFGRFGFRDDGLFGLDHGFEAVVSRFRVFRVVKCLGEIAFAEAVLGRLVDYRDGGEILFVDIVEIVRVDFRIVLIFNIVYQFIVFRYPFFVFR